MSTIPRPAFPNDDPRLTIARHSLSIFAELEIIRDENLRWLRNYGDEIEHYAHTRVQNIKSSGGKKKNSSNVKEASTVKRSSKPQSLGKKPKKSVRSPLTPLKSHTTNGDWKNVVNANYKSPTSTRVNDKQEFSIKDVHVEGTKSDTKEDNIAIPTRETSLRNTPAQKVGQKPPFPTTQSKANAVSIFASSRTPAMPPRHVNLPPSPSSHFLPKNPNRTSALGSVGLGSNVGKVSISGNSSSNPFGANRRTLGRLDSDFGLRQNLNASRAISQTTSGSKPEESRTSTNDEDVASSSNNHTDDVVNPIEALKHKVESMRGVSTHNAESRHKSNEEDTSRIRLDGETDQMETDDNAEKEKIEEHEVHQKLLKESQPKRDNETEKSNNTVAEDNDEQITATEVENFVHEDIDTNEHDQSEMQYFQAQEQSRSKDTEEEQTEFKTPEQEEPPKTPSEEIDNQSFTPPGDPDKSLWRNHYSQHAKRKHELQHARANATLVDDGQSESVPETRNESTPQKERPLFIPSKSGLPKSSSASSIATITKTGSMRNVPHLSPTKKAKMDVKNIQMAAAAAKRDKEEQERKNALKEQKRLAIQQKKTELLANEHNSKKRKEPLSRSLNAQTASSAAKKVAKLTPKASYRPNTTQGASGQAGNQSLNQSMIQASNTTRSIPKPTAMKQSLAQLQAAQPMQSTSTHQDHPESESFELPHINSEYSDSDSEDKKKKEAELPPWAQSPNLHDALMAQSRINPDHLFGAIQPLKMEEIFRGGRSARFRNRTSSANWVHTGDGLTRQEEVEYARRMGYTDQ